MTQDNFYLFGFIYLLLIIRKIYKYSIPVIEEDTLKINENTSISDLAEMKNIDKKNPITDKIWTILNFSCFLWLVIGIDNNQSDKILFILLTGLIILYWMILLYIIIYSVIMIIRNTKSNTSADTNKNKKKPIELTKTLVVTELIIVICILAKHYFLI